LWAIHQSYAAGWLWGQVQGLYGFTVKGTLLESVPLGDLPGRLLFRIWIGRHRQAEDCAATLDSIKNAGTIGTAILRSSVEVSIAALEQCPLGAGAIRAVALRAKVVKSRQRAARGDVEDSPAALAIVAGASGPRASWSR